MDQLPPNRSREQGLTLLADISATEERLYDGSTSGWAADAILLQRLLHLLTLHQFTGSLHSPEEGCLSVGSGWAGLLLLQLRSVWSLLPLDKRGHHSSRWLFVLRLLILLILIGLHHRLPPRVGNYSPAGTKAYALDCSLDRRLLILHVGIKGSEESSRDEVVDLLLLVAGKYPTLTGRYDRMVVGHLTIVDDTL